MLAAFVCAIGHGGVVHTPGTSSAIGVSRSYAPNCNRCVTIYNYGQNYVKHYVDGHVHDMGWNPAEMPIAATILNSTHVLAQADTQNGNRFGVSGRGGHRAAVECNLGSASIKFVDGTLPTLLNLDTGTVSEVDLDNMTCTKIIDYPLDVSAHTPLFDEAKFYGYAARAERQCWFLGTAEGGARAECFAGGGRALVFRTGQLNDGFAHSNIHSCGDIFFEGSMLYVANGDTSPGSLVEARPQSLKYACGKLLRFGLSDTAGTIVGVGLRNPWTTAATGIAGERVIGNVGQYSSEDVFLVRLAERVNFGWPKYEGNLFRSAVAPYTAGFARAESIYADTKRAALLQSYFFGYYIALLAPFVFVFARQRCTAVAGLAAFLTLGLPQMTASPGYAGYDNGLVATEMRSLGPVAKSTMYELYDAWFLMAVCLPLSLLLLLAGKRAGGVVGVVYLTTLMALIEPPARITPLPVFAYGAIAAVLWKTGEEVQYEKVMET